MASTRTVVLLIRHGHTDAVGSRLVSRLPGVSLNADGRADVERLRAALAREPIRGVYSSPLERALETAAPIAADHVVPLRRCDGLAEVDFGDWTGMAFADLDTREDWRRFNEHRGSAVVPGGENPPAVQARVLRCLRRLHAQHPGEVVAAVSHADVIRAALLYYAALPLDAWQQIDVPPGSVSAVALDGDGSGSEILHINGAHIHSA